jgi:hypothetical protein
MRTTCLKRRAAHDGGVDGLRRMRQCRLDRPYASDRGPTLISLQQLTVLGALTMPEYGGNRDGLGWQLIGFADQHAFAPTISLTHGSCRIVGSR